MDQILERPALAAFLTLALLSAAAYLLLTLRPPSDLRSLVKTIPVASLGLAAAVLGAPALLVVALLLGALGDFALSRPKELAFLAGLASFAVSHLAYLALLIGTGSDWPSVPVVIALLGFTGVMVALLLPATGKLRAPVLVYVVLIAAMGLAALGHPDPRVTVAALLFLMSDSLLATELFLIRDDHPARPPVARAVWITYIAAQAGFFVAFLP